MLSPDCGSPSDAEEPPGEIASADRSGLAGQDEERGLEGVFGEVFVADDPPADSGHQDRMPPYQQFERGVIARSGKSREQIRIRNRFAGLDRSGSQQMREPVPHGSPLVSHTLEEARE